MRTVLVRAIGALLCGSVVLAGAACGDDDSGSSSPERIVVTTSILGDVVSELVGDDATVEVVMPAGVDPHDFAASARQAASMREAGVLVVNGLGFEAGLQDTIDAAAADGVQVIEVAELAPDHLVVGEEEHAEDDHAEDDHAEDEHGHDHEGEDPHVFTDPARMVVAVAALAEELADAVPALDSDGFRARAAAYVDELEALDAEIEALLAPIPPERRVLVTNHEVLGYFADRYDFEVLGTVIPSLSTLAEPSAAELHELADALQEAGVPAVFAESSAPARLAEALAAEGLAVEVVALYSESLGEPGSGADTYVGMVRLNAQRIADALR